MKNLISLFAVALFSTSVFAARVPTADEWWQQLNDFEKAPSIAKYIDYLKKDKYDMLTSIAPVGVEVLRTPGKSHFAISTVRDRLNPLAPLGSVEENLTFLKLLVAKGLDVNGQQSDMQFYKLSMLEAASKNCSSDALNFLFMNGVVNEQDSSLWINSLFNQSFRASESMTTECVKSTRLLIKGQRNILVENGDWHALFQSEALGIMAKFNLGAILIQRLSVDQEIGQTLKKILNINPSKKPVSPRPSEEFLNKLDEMINTPHNVSDVDARMIYFWNTLTPDQKEWACYRSSLDEGLEYLQSRGYDLNELKTKPLLKMYNVDAFGPSWIDVIFPYCESLK